MEIRTIEIEAQREKTLAMDIASTLQTGEVLPTDQKELIAIFETRTGETISARDFHYIYQALVKAGVLIMNHSQNVHTVETENTAQISEVKFEKREVVADDSEIMNIVHQAQRALKTFKNKVLNYADMDSLLEIFLPESIQEVRVRVKLALIKAKVIEEIRGVSFRDRSYRIIGENTNSVAA